MTERMENALNHIKTAVDVDPWAMEEVEKVFKGIDEVIAEIKRRIRVLENDLKDDRFYQGKLLGCKVCLDEIRKHTGIGENE